MIKICKFIILFILLLTMTGCVAGLDKVLLDTKNSVKNFIQQDEKQQHQKEKIKELNNNKLTLEYQKHLDVSHVGGKYVVVPKIDRIVFWNESPIEKSVVEIWDAKKLKKLYSYELSTTNERIKKNIVNQKLGFAYTYSVKEVQNTFEYKIYMWNIVSGKTIQTLTVPKNSGYISDIILDDKNNKLLLFGKKIQVLDLNTYAIEKSFSNTFQIKWKFNDNFSQHSNYLYLKDKKQLFYTQKEGKNFNKQKDVFYLVDFNEEEVYKGGNIFNDYNIYSMYLSEAYDGSIIFTYDNKIEIKTLGQAKTKITIETNHKDMTILGFLNSKYLYYIVDDSLQVYDTEVRKYIFISKKQKTKLERQVAGLFPIERTNYLGKHDAFFLDTNTGYVYEKYKQTIFAYELKQGIIKQKSYKLSEWVSPKNLNYVTKYSSLFLKNGRELVHLDLKNKIFTFLNSVNSTFESGHFYKNDFIYMKNENSEEEKNNIVNVAKFDFLQFKYLSTKLDNEFTEYYNGHDDSRFYNNEKFYLYSKDNQKNRTTIYLFNKQGKLQKKKFVEGSKSFKTFFKDNDIVLIRNKKQNVFEILVLDGNSLREKFSKDIQLNLFDRSSSYEQDISYVDNKIFFTKKANLDENTNSNFLSPKCFDLNTKKIYEIYLEPFNPLDFKLIYPEKLLAENNIEGMKTYSIPSDVTNLLYGKKNIYATAVTNYSYAQKYKKKIDYLMSQKYGLTNGYNYVHSTHGIVSFAIWSKDGKLLKEFH